MRPRAISARCLRQQCPSIPPANPPHQGVDAEFLRKLVGPESAQGAAASGWGQGALLPLEEGVTLSDKDVERTRTGDVGGDEEGEVVGDEGVEVEG